METVVTMQRKYVKFNDSSDTTRKTLDAALPCIELVDIVINSHYSLLYHDPVLLQILK